MVTFAAYAENLRDGASMGYGVVWERVVSNILPAKNAAVVFQILCLFVIISNIHFFH